MKANEYLSEYSARADTFLTGFFEDKLRDVDQESKKFSASSDVILYTVNSYWNYAKGGKKLRGSLVQLGYESTGGSRDVILPPSTGMEILHNSLLIHDDILDQDDLRRGKPSSHRQFEEWGRTNLQRTDAPHYGSSMAILSGDLGYVWGNELLLSGDFPPDRKVRVGQIINHVLERTLYGQILDLSQSETSREGDILRIHYYKTALYTLSGPLQIGGTLGGAEANNLEAMKSYGESIGIAFQLRDDELGLFGDEQKLGKPIGSDVRENKNTILRIKAAELATPSEQAVLDRSYGNQDLNLDDLDKVREITVRTGAFNYSQAMANELIEKGKTAVFNITPFSDHQDTLLDIADFITSRNK